MTPQPTSNWQVFRSLWRAARLRGRGRAKRQAQHMQRKTGSDADPLAALAVLFMIVATGVIHLGLGFTLVGAVDRAQMLEQESRGRLVVGSYQERYLDPAYKGDRREWMEELAREAGRWRSREFGGDDETQRNKVLAHARLHGREGFISERDAVRWKLSDPDQLTASVWCVIGLTMVWWFGMLVLQGAGLEMDFQRRRFPMWEWLATHPVRPAVAFAAEMLEVFMVNPIFWGAPLFWCVVWSAVFGFGWDVLLGAVLVGVSLAVVASCLHKALEIAVLLRFPSRTRGAVLGLMSWAGYCLMMLPLFLFGVPTLKRWLLGAAMPLGAWVPSWPARWLLAGWATTPTLWQAGVLLAGGASLVLGVAVLVSWWGVQRGLQAQSASAPAASRRGGSGHPGVLARFPLYRKELLWFWRDKGAVVQAVLIPLTIGAMQAFNLRGLAEIAAGSWNGMCGLGVVCGTYFLLVLGPRSLVSEGAALWMTLTWPQGLEGLLKAKARLWWMLASLVVGIAFVITVVFFPAAWWKIALVALGWLVFSYSLAEKSVTLVTAPSSSGEVEPVPTGRKWAAMLGTLAFGSGVITQNWHGVVLGVVFSALSAAAMWQNLRARLPFLYDPWSEDLPPPPTLMHAMIGVTLMVEAVAVVTGVAIVATSLENFWLIRSFAYGIVGLLVWLGMGFFLSSRGVRLRDVWYWSRPGGEAWPRLVVASVGVAAGFALGFLATVYLMFAGDVSFFREQIEATNKFFAAYPGGWWWQFLLAVGFAPVAEEFFFRGLLYRALDREWGGGAALVGSAAFFAIYHPPISWIPVFMVGVTSAWLFKKTGRLEACVVLHGTYNAVVMLAM